MTAAPAAPNEELRQAHAAERERKHLDGVLFDTRARRRELAERVRALETGAAREERQAERLAGGPLAGLYKMLGSLEERRDRERQEAVAAALKLDEARVEEALLDEEIAVLERRAAAVAGATARLAAAMAAKEAWLRAHDHAGARALAALDEEEAGLHAQLQEASQAQGAARAAARLVASIEVDLNAASGWGIGDLVGGGAVVSAVKHAQMDQARRQVPALETAMRRLAAECADLGIGVPRPPVAPGQTGWFADVFLDNLISDWSFMTSLGGTRDAVARCAQLIAQADAAISRRTLELTAAVEEARKQRARIVGGDPGGR